MSQESVEIARAAWRDYLAEGIDGALAYFAEDCVSEDFPELPDRATYLGPAGWRQRNEQFSRPWVDLVFEPEEFIDAGDGVVVVTATMHGHGGGSDLPMRTPFAFVYEVRDGSIVRDRAFTSRAQAMNAAGLSE